MIVEKGALYGKIDLSSIGGTYLHLFNTHTQSTESQISDEQYVLSYVARYEQIKEVRSFIRRLVFDNEHNFDKARDLVEGNPLHRLE